MSANVEMLAALIQQRDEEEVRRQEEARRVRAEAKRLRKIEHQIYRLDSLKRSISYKQQIITLDKSCVAAGGTRERSKNWWAKELAVDENELWLLYMDVEDLFADAETDEVADKAFAMIRDDRKHLYRPMMNDDQEVVG